MNSNSTNKEESEAISSEHENETNTFLEFENFSKFFETFSSNIKETVTSSTKVPLKETDLEYFMTMPSFKAFVETENERILTLIGKIMKQQNIKKTNIASKKLDDEERMDLLIDINDQMIEKLGIQLDEIQGLRKKTETELKLSDQGLNTTTRNITTSWNKQIGMVSKQSVETTSKFDVKFKLTDKKSGYVQTQKSQLEFKDKIDNSHLPFVPKLRSKPNALVPLAEVFSKLDEFEINQELFEQNLELLENPYTYEIETLMLNEEDNLDNTDLNQIISLETSSYKYVDNLQDLQSLCDHLSIKNRKNIKEISVDLEHHSYRSFLGFTCLMQISTRTDDFLIDTLKLRHEMHRLNEIFTDFTLLKIFHGADYDIEWLQKDFGIYVVNMFDTGQAARVLQYPHFSLSYLLQKFCNIQAQKQFQLADWRQRPLSQDMIKYAREDTRYLIYIYNQLKQELLKLNQLATVFEKSKSICKKVYKKPVFYTKGFLTLCQNNSHLNPKQTKALHDLYKWRDRVAREKDESCEYVLKNHQLLKIAELLPREIHGVLALCNPISPLVETNVHEIHEIIKNAREYSGTSVFLGQEKNLDNEPVKTNIMDSVVHSVVYDPESILNNPHDFPHQNEKLDEEEEIQSEFKTDLNEILLKPVKLDHKQDKPFLLTNKNELKNVFNKNLKSNNLIEKIKAIKCSIENPFEMFLPRELRNKNMEISSKWNLIKAEHKIEIKSQSIEQTVDEVKVEDITMIPLKRQFKLEKGFNEKKLKKKLKDVDFTDAIIKYNNMKKETISALGTEDQNDDDDQQEFSRISEKIKDNLNSLSKLVKNANFGQQQEEFNYDTVDMNQMFSKKKESENKKVDNKLRRTENKFGKVNKRRATNAVTRSKHNKTHTFKSS